MSGEQELPTGSVVRCVAKRRTPAAVDNSAPEFHPSGAPLIEQSSVCRQAGPPLTDAYAEPLFRTAKYRTEFPAKGFASLDEVRTWAAEFVRWYNVDHRHSGIRHVSPQQRPTGDDRAILAARHTLNAQARKRHPACWSGNTREDWSHIGVVTLNPERDAIVNMAANAQHTQQKAA